MRRPGMTLIETLASLALLSGLVLASSSWTITALQSERERTANAQWETACEAWLRQLEMDLAVLDRSTDARPQRVRVDDRRLILRTRRPELGPVEVEYTLDPQAGTVTEQVRPLDTKTSPAEPETVLGHVGSWSASVLIADPTDTNAVLKLSLTPTDGPTVERRWVFDRGLR